MKRKTLIFLIILLSLILLLRILSSLALKEYDFLWFCVVNLFLLILGLYKDNNLLISSVLVSSIIVETFRIIDVTSQLITGKMLLNTANYLVGISTLNYILSFYHVFLIIIPGYIILKEKKFHNKAWILSSLLFLFSSLLSLALTDSNANCARSYCNLGMFNIFYSFRPDFLPFVLFHWIFATILIFIPSHYIIKYIVKRIKKKDGYNRPYRKPRK